MKQLTMTNTSVDARIWDRFAERYSRKSVPDATAYHLKLEKTDSYLTSTDHVLEIGCGTGTTALHHAPKVQQITAIDFSPKMIGIAREKARQAGINNVRFDVCHLDDFATEGKYYDVILAHSVLHLVDDVPSKLIQLKKWLKPNGILIANTQCIGDSAGWLTWVAPLGRTLRLMPKINVFREQQYLSWFENSGFKLEEVWQSDPKASHYTIARAV